MAWLNTANILPDDIKRAWYLDATNGQQVLFDGPVAGTFAYQITSAGYGPTAWFAGSQHGIAAEAAAYRGDWTYEGFVYMNSAANSLIFNAGGWSGQTTEDKNLLAAIVLRNQKIEVWWETGSNTTVTPSAQSAVMSLTAWHHIAVVKDSVAKTLAFYVDGAPSGTATFSANPTGGDTASIGECRMAFGGYLNGWTLPNARIACATFSTAKRDAAWMAASYAHLSTDGTLPTDASTWMGVGPFLRSDSERRGVASPPEEEAVTSGLAVTLPKSYVNYGEPEAEKRRIPIYLFDGTLPITGFVPTSGQLRVSKTGSALVNAAGTWTERGDGVYFYECTVAECTTTSYLVVYVTHPDLTYVRVVDIDTRISAGETSALRRHLPIFLADANGDPLTGMSLTGSALQISKAGGAFSDAAGTVTEVGEGLYDYVATYLDVSDIGPFVLKASAGGSISVSTMNVTDESVFTPEAGGFFGAYFGGTGTFTGSGGGGPIPVPVPIVFGDPEYVDHVTNSVRRLPQQFKSGTIF